MNIPNYEQLQNDLKIKRICRFCLCQHAGKLSSIYMRDTRIKTSAPLPIQIMAIASIEVFTNDGMPCYICTDCTKYFECSYQFKQMCKKADNLLRQFPLTGKWPCELEKPLLPQVDEKTISNNTPKPRSYGHGSRNNHTAQERTRQSKSGGPSIPKDLSLQQSLLNAHASPMKILNADLSIKPELPTPIRPKMENLDEEAATIFLSKIENDDELLIDDVQRLVASVDVEEEELMEEMEFVNMDSLPVVVLDPTDVTVKPIVNVASSNIRPKVLNKSSVRILNKEADKNIEPRLSLPKVKHDEKGNVEIVAEILELDEPYEDEADPKDAAPVEIHVFPCPHCERSFPLRQLRDIHVKNHKRERNFACTECNKSFFSKYDLQKHCLTHSDDKPFKCSACDKSFTRGTLLYRHERSHTDLPKYICVHCERPFLSSEDLNKHIKRHTKHRPFQCKLCHKAFAFKQGLERHEVVHSRQQPYPCQYCDQSFSTTSKLARHLTAHAGDRPYPCKFCAKSYLLSHHLTRHMRSHKNANVHSAIAFNCNICNETFGSRESLITHSTKHATDDSLLCPLCKECFDNLEEVTNHIRHHSDGEAYACEFCDLIYLSSDKLNAHTKADHADDMIAYHENDKVQADKCKVRQRQKANAKSQQQRQQEHEKKRNEIANDNDDLQQTVNLVLTDELIVSTSSKNKIKKELQDAENSPNTFKELSLPNDYCERKLREVDKHDYYDVANDSECDSEAVPLKVCKMELSHSRTTTTKTHPITLKTDKHKLLSLPSTMANCNKKSMSHKKGHNKSKGTPVKVLARKVLEIGMNRKSQSFSPSATNKLQGRQSLLQTNELDVSSVKSSESKVKVQMIGAAKSDSITLKNAGRFHLKKGNMILKNRLIQTKNIK